MRSIFRISSGVSKRISSYDRSGGNKDYVVLPGSSSLTIADIQGPAIIRHIWFTLNSQDPMHRRNIVLRMFWDDETFPSVEAPLGDFFGQGWGEAYTFAALPMAAAPVSGRALNCYFPMPFRHRGRIVMENESPIDVQALYFYVDYELVSDLDADTGYFHAWWHREVTNPAGGVENEWETLGPEPKHASDAGNFLLVEAVGRGHVVGVNFFVDNPTPMWYGEGDDMWLIDGEPWPGSLHGTGTEDFFNSSWCPKEVYTHPYFGWARVSNETGWLGRTHAYRFFLEDPIRFQSSIRGSIEHGHANVLTLDLASVTYWYQTEPHQPYPPFPALAERQPMPRVGEREIHRWRDAWRRQFQGRSVWGHETP